MVENRSLVRDLRATPTSSDVIADYIRNAIADGTLKEGEPIRQDEVAALFNVSKIPVREALKRCEAQGLVVFVRNRGAIVTEMSEPQIAEIFETRALLESQAIRLSVPHMTAETFKKAEALCDEFIGERDAARWSELNWKFHSSLYEDANRAFLLGLIRSVNDRIERYLRIQLTLSDGMTRADDEHREILAACRRGDADRAAELTYNHIITASGSLLKHVANFSRPTVF
ncbi:GntR family transcriptional regulator [Neorhizobium galegae]|uniref:GntR family transcriptional regulator n=1 Tax=Neorhizobium galegae TaxID=399 RepID=UPI0021067B7E|nr:GntR family transcriptional regulator [Neorhizobium galegae]MCQ1774392.1 GntR family transcriptional regulator [Neorhizobium galegae]MCQ1798950.1 GntR family transcriptional regulator [Neorhizobium galegae]